MGLLAAVHESGSGPKETCRSASTNVRSSGRTGLIADGSFWRVAECGMGGPGLRRFALPSGLLLTCQLR